MNDTRACPVCGEPLLPGEATVVPMAGWVDADGVQAAGGRERWPEHAIHARCLLAHRDQAEAHLRSLLDDERKGEP